MITIFARVVCFQTFQNFTKQNKVQTRIVIATGGTVSLAEWIIDDTLVFFVLTYRASVWFLSRVPPHVYDQHVLSLERLLLPRAVLPLTNEGLLAVTDVIVVEMSDQAVLSTEISVAFEPMAMSFDEVRLCIVFGC